MSDRGGAVLYTPEILSLAVELADSPLDDSRPLRGEAHSRVCGSRVTVALAADEEGRIAAIGARVTACAIGQAAAALFLRAAEGRDAPAITVALAQVEAWLTGAGPEPDWAGIGALAPTRAFPARHQAILLPWKAAQAALSKLPPAD